MSAIHRLPQVFTVPGASDASAEPYLVFLYGPAATGKSALARELGTQLGWARIDRDQLKSTLISEGVGLSASTDAADQQMLDQAADLLRHGPVVLDCGGHRATLSLKVHAFAAAQDVPVKTILCLAARSIRDRRLATRRTLVSQLPCNTSTFDVPESAYHHLPAGRLLLDMARPLAQTVAQARQFLLAHPLPPNLSTAWPGATSSAHADHQLAA